MRNFLIFFWLILTLSAGAQLLPKKTVNELTSSQFENIKINGITLKSIWNTNGSESAVKNLFGEPTYINKQGEYDEGVLSREYYYEGIELGFYNNFSSIGNLGGFKIVSPSPSIAINGVLLRVGDNITKLGDVLITNMNTGGKSVVYSPSNDETTFLSIQYNETTRVIEKIIYFVLT